MCSSAVMKASAERSLELGDLQLNRRPNHAAVIHDSARSRVRLRHVLGRSCNARRYTSNAWRNVGPFIVRFAAVIRVMSMAMGERGDGINPRGNHGPCDKTNRRAGLCILAGRAATSSFAPQLHGCVVGFPVAAALRASCGRASLHKVAILWQFAPEQFRQHIP